MYPRSSALSSGEDHGGVNEFVALSNTGCEVSRMHLRTCGIKSRKHAGSSRRCMKLTAPG
jgi:hypothetical protein